VASSWDFSKSVSYSRPFKTSSSHARHRYNRATPLLPPSITLSRFPVPASSSSSALPTLHCILSDLLPQYLTVPLSLDLLNKENFSPESKDEDLHSGYLQVPHGTTLLLTENNLQEGKLVEKGMMKFKATLASDVDILLRRYHEH